MDTALLQDSLTKAEAKLAKLRAQYEAAEKECEELKTALRVIERLTGQTAATSAPAVNDNGATILKYLGFGEAEGRSPKEIHETIELIEGGLGADLIRTQLWRMAKRGIIESANSKYWRPEAERPKAENVKAPDASTSEALNGSGPVGREGGYPPSTPEGSIPSGSTPFHVGFDSDLDDDVPF